MKINKIYTKIGAPLLMVAPLMTVVACSTSSTIDYDKLKKEAGDHIAKFAEKNFADSIADKKIAGYINYLLKFENKNDISIESLKDTIRVGVDIPFMDVLEDITSDTIGRPIFIEHVGHVHRIFVTWEELAPTKEEIEAYTNSASTRKVHFHIPITNGSLDFTNVGFENNYVNDEHKLSKSYPKVNLSEGTEVVNTLNSNNSYWMNEYKPSLNYYNQLLNNSKDKITNAPTAFTATGLEEQISNLVWDTTKNDEMRMSDYLLMTYGLTNKYVSKTYKGREFLDSEWIYNYYSQGIAASTPHIKMQYDIISMLFNNKDGAGQPVIQNLPFGIDWFELDRNMVNWWTTVKPHNGSSKFYTDPQLLKKFNASAEDEEVFWSNVKSIIDPINEGLDDFKTSVPRDGKDIRNVPFIYYNELHDGHIEDEKHYLSDYNSIASLPLELFYELPTTPTSGTYWETEKHILEDRHNNVAEGNELYRGRKLGEHLVDYWTSFDYSNDFMLITSDLFVEHDHDHLRNYDPINVLKDDTHEHDDHDHEHGEGNFLNDMPYWEFPVLNSDYAFEVDKQLYYVYDRLIFESKDIADTFMSEYNN